MELKFTSFDLEYHRKCQMDRVEIHNDGEGYFLCGKGIPAREFVSKVCVTLVETTNYERGYHRILNYLPR